MQNCLVACVHLVRHPIKISLLRVQQVRLKNSWSCRQARFLRLLINQEFLVEFLKVFVIVSFKVLTSGLVDKTTYLIFRLTLQKVCKIKQIKKLGHSHTI